MGHTKKIIQKIGDNWTLEVLGRVSIHYGNACYYNLTNPDIP